MPRLNIKINDKPISKFITRGAVGIAGAIVAFSLMASGCGDDNSGQSKETGTQQSNYDRLVSQDPAHTMAVSQTRNTINKWIDTWGKDPNKQSYVYMQNANGDLIGFYVLKGLPVSYCTAQTPTYQIKYDDHGNVVVPAPSIDGVYYSGGECNTFYGFDATSGAYIEYTVGLGINVLIYDQPLPNHPNVKNLSPTG